MANNRLYLKVKETNEKVLLAEYCPNTGWYLYDSEKIDNWFDEIVNREKSLLGATNLELEYESDYYDRKTEILCLIQAEMDKRREDEENKGSI